MRKARFFAPMSRTNNRSRRSVGEETRISNSRWQVAKDKNGRDYDSDFVNWKFRLARAIFVCRLIAAGLKLRRLQNRKTPKIGNDGGDNGGGRRSICEVHWPVSRGLRADLENDFIFESRGPTFRFQKVALFCLWGNYFSIFRIQLNGEFGSN